MLLCPIRYDWGDEEYIFFGFFKSVHVHEVIGFVLNFVRFTPTMIILSISAFAGPIEVLMDPATTLKMDF